MACGRLSLGWYSKPDHTWTKFSCAFAEVAFSSCRFLVPELELAPHSATATVRGTFTRSQGWSLADQSMIRSDALIRLPQRKSREYTVMQ